MHIYMAVHVHSTLAFIKQKEKRSKVTHPTIAQPFNSVPSFLSAGSDYIALGDEVIVVFNEEMTEASVNITIVDDEIPEGEEFFAVLLFPIFEADVTVLYSPLRATVVIEDDESSQFQGTVECH